MSITAWIAVAVFAAAYVLIATEWVHRVAAALGGAAVMLLVGATDAGHAFFSPAAGIDWNVIVLLLGMMLIVAVLKRTGAFEYLAIWAVKRARGRPFPVMVILVVVTAVASAMLDNVTTVLLIAPVTFLVCQRLGVPVAPYLIAEAMASNIGGTATLVGDPPNIIVASRAGLAYNDFLNHLAPLIAVLVVVFVLLCRVLFRSAFQADPAKAAAVTQLRERDAIRDPRLLAVSLGVLALVTAAFVLHAVVHLEPSVVAIVGGLALLAVSRLDTGEVIADVEWPTLAFFAGLFVMVGALVNTGAIATLSHGIADAVAGRPHAAAMGLLGGSAVLSAVVDNIPYVATMTPIVADLAAAQGSHGGPHVLWWALTLGADLGGNATAVGASANVVILGLAERAGARISFWQFTKYGLVVAAVTVGISAVYLWLRYLAFA
ncbi:ArsB/NhaD family transporter [Dactylosporangium matsuzakiense]|uniref:Membrane protein n=1 Tax=Dactylosporangium matsuzakiense TaxID=53360 RepID=A0A9W6KS46_9ACTN|nr:ArsB/NhaD family transporter [Dactylosporangium matsuzakiense]UWZ41270.1 ArsB/NhaD family transporter [Dactylosporangium matsuzakiense]GLL05644.1 membrane protein [Dactylosporangium matsuzakiense]